jgi:hypothetical protein
VHDWAVIATTIARLLFHQAAAVFVSDFELKAASLFAAEDY